MSSSDVSPLALKIFYGAFALTQITGFAFMICLMKWISGWGDILPPSRRVWHPILASLGLIILQGESILIFRLLRNVRKSVTKSVHATVHLVAFICVFAALVLVFWEKRGFGIPAGIHGRLGLFSATLYLIQYVAAFVTFLAPGATNNFRQTLLPVHIFGGIFIFLLSCLTVFSKTAEVFPVTSTLLLYALCLSVSGKRRVAEYGTY
ncbi:cytochrome b561 [Galendromus occidentalis]|uniref:Cytochrome b561 n=1 Tax=Galendromus occidentalis TaxID=34638 RepID=A0AAJ6QUW2_9ACAR|nr:cytochrome b561 [Galendromus occidentalis]